MEARRETELGQGVIFQGCPEVPLPILCFGPAPWLHVNGLFVGEKEPVPLKVGALLSPGAPELTATRAIAQARSTCGCFYLHSSWVKANSLTVRGRLSYMKKQERLIAVGNGLCRAVRPPQIP